MAEAPCRAWRSTASRRDFEAIDRQDFRAESLLKTGKQIEVSQDGDVLGSWPIEIIPDNPPTVAFARPPEATVRQALRIDYRAGDDYGVEKVTAVIRRRGGKPAAAHGGNPGEEITTRSAVAGAASQTGAGDQLSRPDALSLGRAAGRDPPRRHRRAGPNGRERDRCG